MRGGYAKLLAERQYRLPLHIIINGSRRVGFASRFDRIRQKKKKRKRGIDLVERASIKKSTNFICPDGLVS